jgi:hypothetical protein
VYWLPLVLTRHFVITKLVNDHYFVALNSLLDRGEARRFLQMFLQAVRTNTADDGNQAELDDMRLNGLQLLLDLLLVYPGLVTDIDPNGEVDDDGQPVASTLKMDDIIESILVLIDVPQDNGNSFIHLIVTSCTHFMSYLVY